MIHRVLHFCFEHFDSVLFKNNSYNSKNLLGVTFSYPCAITYPKIVCLFLFTLIVRFCELREIDISDFLLMAVLLPCLCKMLKSKKIISKEFSCDEQLL